MDIVIYGLQSTEAETNRLRSDSSDLSHNFVAFLRFDPKIIGYKHLNTRSTRFQVMLALKISHYQHPENRRQLWNSVGVLRQLNGSSFLAFYEK